MCYEIYPISHFLFERQKTRHLAIACHHSGLEKSHSTSRRYYPPFGGCRTSTFNYTKDPHKGLGCWSSICTVNGVMTSPKGWLLAAAADRGLLVGSLPDRFTSQSCVGRLRGSAWELCFLFWKATIFFLSSPLSRLVGGCGPPTEPRSKDLALNTHAAPVFSCQSQGEPTLTSK